MAWRGAGKQGGRDGGVRCSSEILELRNVAGCLGKS